MFTKECYIVNSPNKSLLTRGIYKEGVTIFEATSNKITSNRTTSIDKINTISSIKSINTNSSNIVEELEESEDELLADLPSPTSQIEEDSNSFFDLEIDELKNIDLRNIDLNQSKLNSLELWHKRLGHINGKALGFLPKNTLGSTILEEDLKSSNSSIVNLDNCIICIQSKLTKNISKRPSTKVDNYLDLLYIDIGGPIKPITYRGYKYYITFRDSFTKYLVVELLKRRENIVEVIRKVITRLELQSNLKVKSLQVDNEFKSLDLENYTITKAN